MGRFLKILKICTYIFAQLHIWIIFIKNGAKKFIHKLLRGKGDWLCSLKTSFLKNSVLSLWRYEDNLKSSLAFLLLFLICAYDKVFGIYLLCAWTLSFMKGRTFGTGAYSPKHSEKPKIATSLKFWENFSNFIQF